MDEINGSLGEFIRLETTDGLIREGKLSGLRTRQLLLDDAEVDIITEVELNGDPTDTVAINRIAKLNFG